MEINSIRFRENLGERFCVTGSWLNFPPPPQEGAYLALAFSVSLSRRAVISTLTESDESRSSESFRHGAWFATHRREFDGGRQLSARKTRSLIPDGEEPIGPSSIAIL